MTNRTQSHNLLTLRCLLCNGWQPQAAVNIGFTFAFVHTTAAHALLLINLNPLWCAVAGRLFLGDTLPTRTIVALFLAMGCMLVTFVPEIVDNDDDAETTTKGNVISLLTGFAIATYITLVRKGGIEGINMMPVAPTAALVAGIVALAMQRGQVLGHHVPWQAGAWKFWLAMAAEGTMVGIVFVALAIAPRLITGAELALVLLVEVILGPLWVFCAYGETPSSWTLIGGLSLLVLLALHEAIPMIFSQGDEEDVDESSDKAIATKLGEQEDTEKIAATLGDIDQSDTTHPLQQEKSDV